MPEKHLFVNFSHYQDRPDPKLRHRIASHAARYGPNGSLAFKTSLEDTDTIAERSSSAATSRHSPTSPQTTPATPMRRSSSVSSSVPGDIILRRDYETMLSRFDDFCACAESSGPSGAVGKGVMVHSEDCSLLEDYIDLCHQHELPLRVTVQAPLPVPPDGGLVTQCLLMASQAAVDGIDPKFKGKPSNKTLTLQQKALAAMQKVIKSRPTTVDSLIIGSAMHIATAAYFDDTEAYKTHKTSFQKLIDHQGGMNQTKTLRIAKIITSAGEVCLALCRYTSLPRASTLSKKEGPQFPASAPLKLKYSMPPFAPEIVKTIDRMSPGFQTLAKASKLSVQALQIISLVEKWSVSIDQPVSSEAEQKQLLADTAGAQARLLDLYTDSVETQRLAAFLLISLPVDGAHMKLEKCICLGVLNILHSLSLWQYPISIRDRLVIDFTEAIFSLLPKDKDEEECMIWLIIAVASEWRHCAIKLKESPLLARHGHDAVALCQVLVQRSKQLMDWLIVKCERARSWEDITKVCVRFLWLRRLQGEWKLTWKDAVERRMKNLPRKKSRNSP